jgi:hypothetical protein
MPPYCIYIHDRSLLALTNYDAYSCSPTRCSTPARVASAMCRLEVGEIITATITTWYNVLGSNCLISGYHQATYITQWSLAIGCDDTNHILAITFVCVIISTIMTTTFTATPALLAVSGATLADSLTSNSTAVSARITHLRTTRQCHNR